MIRLIITAAAAILLCISGSTAAKGRTQSTHKPTATAQHKYGMKSLKNWEAGNIVDINEVEAFGMSRCFASTEIPDEVFARMSGKSYKKGCTVARTVLRYVKVLHYGLDGKIRIGELVCHKDVAADMVDIFRNLFRAKYPIERMVLIDNYDADDEKAMLANNTSCFNFRYVAGTKVPSNHSWGKAIDVNPLYNPYVKKRKDGTLKVSPAAGRRYADRTKAFRCKIDRNDLCYKEFTSHGFVWGGSWKRSKDYQHFEKAK